MTQPFGEGYASAYDALYADKDYAAEAALVRSLLERFADGPTRSILELGCGTGGHAVLLAQAGFEVTGVDGSPAMLARAEAKARSAGVALRVHESDIAALSLGGTYDAALMMFAVLGYLVDDDACLAALRAARGHLRPGGLLLFDAWFGPAVLRHRPVVREKHVGPAGAELVRRATPSLDVVRQVCEVRYELSGAGSAPVEETHRMRFFFAAELRLLLAAAGFSMLQLGQFPGVDVPPDEDSWNVMVVARAT